MLQLSQVLKIFPAHLFDRTRSSGQNQNIRKNFIDKNWQIKYFFIFFKIQSCDGFIFEGVYYERLRVDNGFFIHEACNLIVNIFEVGGRNRFTWNLLSCFAGKSFEGQDQKPQQQKTSEKNIEAQKVITSTNFCMNYFIFVNLLHCLIFHFTSL